MIRANEKGLAAQPVVVEGGSRRPSLVSPRNILIVVGVVAWLAVVVLFVIPRFTAKAPAAAPAGTQVASAQGQAAAAVQPATAAGTGEAAIAAGPKAVSAPEVTIDGRVINLAGNTGYKYIKLSLVVQFADPTHKFAKAKADALKTMNAAFLADNPGMLAAFNDILTSTVSGDTAGDLSTPQGKQALRQALITRFNQALGGRQQVTYINFTDFVMQ
ncbi:MAG: flagellar basal body-associated FliL family protein [Chloroflexota bacterium]